MKCDFCNQEFPAEELEMKTGALHDSGDVEKYHVCETCAAWLDENTGRRAEKWRTLSGSRKARRHWRMQLFGYG